MTLTIEVSAELERKLEAEAQNNGVGKNEFAKIDLGAEVCLFERKIAETLEIDIKSGYREVFSTLAGDLIAFQHEIEFETLGLQFQTRVYFAESYTVIRNLLGRRGFLQLVKIGLDDYSSELYLSPRF